MNKRVYTVAQVNQYIRNMFAGDGFLSAVSVSGEVSNCKFHSSGHIYFSLKDAGGQISCVMFAGNRKGLAFRMKDGDKVVVSGKVDLYERSGSYQLYAYRIELQGLGDLYERFLALKCELSEQGLFDPVYKKQIPRYAKTVGVVTAPTGAAVRDIQMISRRRNPYVQLILYPALVQGDGAKESIVEGIRVLDRIGVDVIIVGRGGGSLEDLWAFNEEEVARAVFACETPIISAVGHETDTTIADLAADLRASTPSAAAELAVFDLQEFRNLNSHYRNMFNRSMMLKISGVKNRIGRCRVKMTALSPQMKVLNERHKQEVLVMAFSDALQRKIDSSRNRREDIGNRLTVDLRRLLDIRERKFAVLVEQFKGRNPLDRLKQGYSYVDRPDGHAVRSVVSIRRGDPLRIHVTDGTILTEVKEISQNDRRTESE